MPWEPESAMPKVLQLSQSARDSPSPLHTSGHARPPRRPLKHITSFFTLTKSRKRPVGFVIHSDTIPLVDAGRHSGSPAETDQRDPRSESRKTVQSTSEWPMESKQDSPNAGSVKLKQTSDDVAIEEKLQRRMTMSSFRRDNHVRGSGDSVSNFDTQIMQESRKRPKLPRWLSSQSANKSPGSGNHSPSYEEPASSRRKHSMILQLESTEQDYQPAASRQRMISIGELVTPGASEGPPHLGRRRAVRSDGLRQPGPLIMDDRARGKYLYRQPSSPDLDVDLYATPTRRSPAAMQSRRRKHRSYFGDSIVEDDDFYRPLESLRQMEEPVGRSRTRVDVEIEHGAAYGQTSEVIAAVRDIPDHLSNSPLCP